MLRRRIEDLAIGTKATLYVWRDGKTFQVDVELEETPTTAVEAKTAASEALEFAVRQITFLDRVRYDWPSDQKGVIVANVVMGGGASLGGLGVGDLILEIGDRPIGSISDFEEALKAIGEAKPPTVRIFVRRGYRTAFVFLEPEWNRETEEGND
jgi:serine protease Do